MRLQPGFQVVLPQKSDERFRRGLRRQGADHSRGNALAILLQVGIRLGDQVNDLFIPHRHRIRKRNRMGGFSHKIEWRSDDRVMRSAKPESLLLVEMSGSVVE